MIAIDFGTTNSSIAVLSEGDTEPRLQPVAYADQDSYNPNVLPSVVCRCATHLCRHKQYTYGHEALRHGFEQQHDTKLLQEMKLYFDRSTLEPPLLVEKKFVVGLREEGGVLNPITETRRLPIYNDVVPLQPNEFVPATGKLIAEMVGRSNVKGQEASRLVIGFPASFHAKGVRQLREAAKTGVFAGRDPGDKISMYFEPAAAARAYLNIAEGNVLVLDYGGGTLDISVMTLRGAQTLERSDIKISGFPEAGSKMDEAIVEYCLLSNSKAKAWFEKQPLRSKLGFKRAIERAKISLSTQRDATVEVPGSGLDPITLTAEGVAYALQPTLIRMAAKVSQAVFEALGSIDKVDFVVMSGGTSLNETVQRSVLAMFRHLPEDKFLLPDARDPAKLETCLCAVAKGLLLLRMDGHPSVEISSVAEDNVPHPA